MNKRYAIVRVDNVCPNIHDIHYKFVCENSNNFKNENCKNCRYGDTKEQLIRKVAQAIRKPICEGNLNFSSKGFRYSVIRLAKEIVEFLGVVE